MLAAPEARKALSTATCTQKEISYHQPPIFGLISFWTCVASSTPFSQGAGAGHSGKKAVHGSGLR